MAQPKLIDQTLWIFGPSMCRAHSVQEEQGWPFKLANKIKCSYKNFAEVAADNFFIYSSYLENKKHISSNDIVVIGWSHPSRKSFVFDDTNSAHRKILDKSLVYEQPNRKFIRSYNPINDSFFKWANLFPKSSGNEFYDTWFKNYYSDYEQECNLQSYYDSVKLTCKGQYIPFFFNKQSIVNIDVTGIGFMLEFVTENQVYISENDMHLNPTGHALWADHLNNYIKQ